MLKLAQHYVHTTIGRNKCKHKEDLVKQFHEIGILMFERFILSSSFLLSIFFDVLFSFLFLRFGTLC